MQYILVLHDFSFLFIYILISDPHYLFDVFLIYV